MDYSNIINSVFGVEVTERAKRNKIIKSFAGQYKMLQSKCMQEFNCMIIEDPEGDIRDVGGYAAALFDGRTGKPDSVIVSWLYCKPKFIVEKIVACAHEMGHFRDINEVGIAVFQKEHDGFWSTLKQEYRAWVYAVDILREIDFQHWDAFMMMFNMHFLGYCDQTNWLPPEVMSMNKEKLRDEYSARLACVVGTKEVEYEMV